MTHILVRGSSLSEYDPQDFAVLVEINPTQLKACVEAAKVAHDSVGAHCLHVYDNVDWFDFSVLSEEEANLFTSDDRSLIVISDERATEISDKGIPERINGDTLVVHYDGDLWYEAWFKHGDERVNTRMFNLTDLEGVL